MASEMLTQAAIIGAGAGSRLWKGLLAADEISAQAAYEKPLVLAVPADPENPDDGGVASIELAIGDILVAAEDIQALTILTNPGSQVPKRLRHPTMGDVIDTKALLERQGRWANASSNLARFVAWRCVEQPSRSEEYDFYGTAWAMHLALDSMKLGENEPVIITESDGILYNPEGSSELASLIRGVQSNERGATAGLLVSSVIPTEAASQNGLVLSETAGGETYRVDVLEFPKPGEADRRIASGLRGGKNTTRLYADAKLRQHLDIAARRDPSPRNKGERQATDALREYDDPLLVVETGVEYGDLGSYSGLQRVRTTLSGLRDSRNPRWDQAAA